VTAQARLAKVEAALTPKVAVLRWLDEIHAYSSLLDYVAALIAEHPGAAPLDRLAEQVEAGVRASMKGMRGEDVYAASRRAVREVTFLYSLIIQIHLAAAEAIRLEGLRQAALFFWRRLLEVETVAGSGAPEPPAGLTSLAERQESWRAAAGSLVTTIHSSEEARTLIEKSYFDGRRVLDPVLTQGWEALRRGSEALRRRSEALLNSMSEDGGDPGLAALRASTQAQAHDRAAELVDLAHVHTLQLLDETHRAARVFERWLRAAS
jgi:hypothetical protein